MKLDIKLKNCYGISTLEKSFYFSQNKTFLIYASNGVMKTSFARTFSMLQKGREPVEEIHGRKCEWNIKIDDQEIQKEEIFVVKPYIQKYKPENISTLLVDEKNKKKYEIELKAISKQKNSFLSILNKKSGKTKNEIESIILNDFHTRGSLISFLQNIDFENIENNYSDIKYSHIFEDKVLELLKTKGIKDNISQYTQKYNELIQEVPYFDKGSLNPSRADNVLKSLKTNKFFGKDNLVKLSGEDRLLNENDLKTKFIEAKKKLVEDEKLKQIQDLITKNAKVEAFQTLLENKPEIINELNDLDSLKKKIWNSYFADNKNEIEDLLSLYNEKKSILEDIENKALLQKTRWQEVVKTFEQRFKPPFKVDIKDHKSTILGKTTSVIVFKFWNKEKKNYTELNRDSLEGVEVLSQGERRALYLLNIIFEIETRVLNNTRTLFIIDDIADSFDYRNKYAIIEYLNEIPSKSDMFYQIILTHNFDFFRTVHSSLNLPYKACYIANRTTHSIELDDIVNLGIINPFKNWRDKIKKDNSDRKKYFIAMIPFARELASYLEKSQEDKEGILNALLHVTDKTKSITIEDLENIFKNILGLELKNTDKLKKDKVFSIMLKVADDISNKNTEDIINLENKVVLSMVIRLKAEYYMKSFGIILDGKIGKTFEKWKGEYKEKKETKLLEEVVIMTPENIHLNSFMYEPILDMSDSRLKELYKDISNLYYSIENNNIKDAA